MNEYTDAAKPLGTPITLTGTHHDIMGSLRKGTLNTEQREFVSSIITMTTRDHPEIMDSWKVSTGRDGSVSVASPSFEATYDMKNLLVYVDIDGSKTSMGRNKVAGKINDALSCHNMLYDDDIIAEISRMRGM